MKKSQARNGNYILAPMEGSIGQKCQQRQVLKGDSKKKKKQTPPERRVNTESHSFKCRRNGERATFPEERE